MKYIRTKNGRIIDISNKEIDINCRNDIVFEDNTYIPADDIIKVADTIEELCDYFVYTDGGCFPIIVDELELDLMQTEPVIIYGAILTERGLKNVAKVNDKGELELL